MKIFGVDTSTLSQSLCICDDDVVVASTYRRRIRGHGRALAPALVSLLDALGLVPGDLDALVVGRGPGSFTGLRIGLAFCQGLGASLHLPVHAVPSWRAAGAVLPAGDLLIHASDARKREISGGICTTGASGAVLLEVGTHAPAEFAALAMNRIPQARRCWLSGDAFSLHRDALAPLLGMPSAVRFDQDCPPAEGLVRTFMHAAESFPTGPGPIEPIYSRPSEAEIGLMNKARS